MRSIIAEKGDKGSKKAQNSNILQSLDSNEKIEEVIVENMTKNSEIGKQEGLEEKSKEETG